MPERFTTLAETFDHQVRKYEERVFLRQKRDKVWKDFSWREIATAASRLRAGLTKLGIKPGDRVGILSDNSPQWVIVDQAALGMGAIVVPLYTTSGTEETRHVINDSGARLVAAGSDEMVQKLIGLGSSIPGVERIIAMHPRASARDKSFGTPPVITLDSASSDPPAPIVEAGRDDIATLIYTSGTTGPSKGVMLSHGNILSNCEDALNVLELHERDIALSILPVAHSFERTGGYYAMMCAGVTIAYAEGLTQIAPNLLEIRPTLLLVVPRLLEAVYARVQRTVETSGWFRRKLFQLAFDTGNRATECRHRGQPVPAWLGLKMALFRKLVFHRIGAIFGGRLRVLVSGGAPLSVEVNRFFAAAEIPVIEGYGLTEAAPVVAVNLFSGKVKIGTVGQALPSVQVKTAPDGELLVHGPNVMKGYWQHEQETREAIDADGWLHTGDIASIDSDGYIKITDRKKEIIVLSGGKNVSPANLETKLVTDPYIAQACVVGDRRKHLAALLVPNLEALRGVLKQKGVEGKPIEELVKSPELRAFYLARLREFNKPLSDVEAISAFTLVARPFTQEDGELTPTLKLRRKAVQEHYREQIEAMYRD
jgi:long-chain acyl-CoA synthetase